MKTRIRTICLFLTVLMVCAATVSCAVSEEPADVTPSATDTPDPTDTEDPESELNASTVLLQYDNTVATGKEFRIWSSNEINSSITIQQVPGEEITGDRINDSLLNRDNTIEEYFGVDIVYNLINPDTSVLQKAVNSIGSGDDEVDLVFGNLITVSLGLFNQGLIRNLADIDEIKTENAWWNQICVRDMAVNDELYFLTGDISPRTTFAPYIMMFNQKLLKDYGIDYPYDVARSGEWTFEYFATLIEDTYQDLDTNETQSMDDFYGFVNNGAIYPFYNGFNRTPLDISDGEAVLTCDSDEDISMMETIAELFAMPDVLKHNFKDLYDVVTIFVNNQALFTSQTVGNLFLFSSMENDYGILPLPKYDEDQDGYYSFVDGWCATSVMIPVTVTDDRRVGTLTEAMAALSSFTCAPAAYEQTLLNRQARDEESVEMLKLTVAGSLYDLNYLFNWGNLREKLTAAMTSGEGFASAIEECREAALAAAQKTIEQFDDNAN